MIMTYLEKLLLKHEGIRLKPYKDTVGKTTIGIGRNLDDVGISEYEAMVLLRSDIDRVLQDLQAYAPWALELQPDTRRIVVVDMVFNLGIHGFLKFRRATAAMKAGMWEDAAVEMLDSKWARQVGRRARELAEMMRTGVKADV